MYRFILLIIVLLLVGCGAPQPTKQNVVIVTAVAVAPTVALSPMSQPTTTTSPTATPKPTVPPATSGPAPSNTVLPTAASVAVSRAGLGILLSVVQAHFEKQPDGFQFVEATPRDGVPGVTGTSPTSKGVTIDLRGTQAELQEAQVQVTKEAKSEDGLKNMIELLRVTVPSIGEPAVWLQPVLDEGLKNSVATKIEGDRLISIIAAQPIGFLLLSVLPAPSNVDAASATVTPLAGSAQTAKPDTPNPTVSSATSGGGVNPAAVALKVVGQGFAQKRIALGYGFLIENPNQGLAADGVNYQIVAYAEDGTVLKTEDGSMPLIMPGEKAGVAGDLYLPEGATVAKIDIQVRTNTYDSMVPQGRPFFAPENTKYIHDQYFPKVTGVIKSNIAKDVKQLYVAAIAFNAKDEIVGGGRTYLAFLPAKGQAAVEVPLTAREKPAKVELYPAFSTLSIMQLDK